MRAMRFSCVSGSTNCRFAREKMRLSPDTAHDESFVRKILKRDWCARKSAVRPIRWLRADFPGAGTLRRSVTAVMGPPPRRDFCGRRMRGRCPLSAATHELAYFSHLSEIAWYSPVDSARCSH
ncbi:hypothetical protein DF051_24505 [Burkholderia contaminans]|uniref:Uncharacterized protein n=1 Tax=Burkholderia contaminans TaxID=488447 RepID=A0A3N8PJL1_9BURK|nr:hypothetical protein DF051_24505 [Burkholderia contaminans]